eukprot:884595-Rhodomonas_salina.1
MGVSITTRNCTAGGIHTRRRGSWRSVKQPEYSPLQQELKVTVRSSGPEVRTSGTDSSDKNRGRTLRFHARSFAQ